MMAASAGGFWGSLWLVLCGVPLVLGIVALPLWPWSRSWGYVPSAGLLLVSLFVLLLHVNYIV
jgi:Protein of unknown function (DUF3309)